MPLRIDESRKILLAREIMEAAIDKMTVLGVQVKFGEMIMRKERLFYKFTGAVDEPNRSRNWPSEWNKFKLVIDRTAQTSVSTNR